MTDLQPPHEDLRRRYTDEALTYIPRLFQLVDRNQYSPTYGCFDRSFWHYRTMDFPSGMYQEFCLPLAMAYAHDFPDNPYHAIQRVKELALAGVDYAAHSAHNDGTCDDYFPNERALGALVFSLNACAQTMQLLNCKDSRLLEFIERRALYLLRNNESGQLSNHQALAALALYGSWELTGNQKLKVASQQYVDIVRSWQSPEGWFQEYEGADPGYHTCTISFLAKLFQKSKDESLLQLMNPAVDFAWHFMHPDGSYGGEYGSRNTYHFYPYGFEVMAPHNRRAAAVADMFLTRAIPRRTRYFNDDDRMCAHYLYDWMQSYLDFSPQRSRLEDLTPDIQQWFPHAGMFVKRTPEYHAVLNLSKGGVLKVTNEDGPIFSDTGIIARTAKNEVIVSHIVHKQNGIEADEATESFRVSGTMCKRSSKYSSPLKQILFRILNLTMGFFNENLLRSFLQKVLITGKRETNISFSKTVRFTHDSISLESTLQTSDKTQQLKSAHIASDATSIYVANSNVYQQSVLQPWYALNKFCEEFNRNATATARVAIRNGKVTVL